MKSTTLLAIAAGVLVFLGFQIGSTAGQSRILFVHNKFHQIKTVSNNAVGRTVRDLKRQGYKILRVFKVAPPQKRNLKKYPKVKR